jgi:hypothetical protein
LNPPQPSEFVLATVLTAAQAFAQRGSRLAWAGLTPGSPQTEEAELPGASCEIIGGLTNRAVKSPSIFFSENCGPKFAKNFRNLHWREKYSRNR